MFFTATVSDETRYLHWDPKEQLLLLVPDEALGTPIEKVNEIMRSLLADPSFTRNLEMFTGVPTSQNVTYLNYIHVAKPYLKNKASDTTSGNWLSTHQIIGMLEAVVSSSENIRKIIRTACKEGNEKKISEYIARGLSKNKKDYLLDVAFEHDRMSIVLMVLKSGVPNKKIQSLLVNALRSNQIEVVKMLWDFIDKETRQRSLCIAIEQMASIEILDSLIHLGASMNVCNEEGWPLLCMAAFGDNVDQVKWLLSRGVDVNATTPLKSTPLHFAAMSNFVAVGKVLLEAGAKSDLLDEYGYTAPKWAVASGFNEKDFTLDLKT